MQKGKKVQNVPHFNIKQTVNSYNLNISVDMDRELFEPYPGAHKWDVTIS